MYLPRRADLWLPGYLRSLLDGWRERRQVIDVTDILFCLVDHYEPLLGGAPPDVGLRRVLAWRENYPRLFAEFCDADGRPPQHTFFFPIEQYRPEYLEPLAELTRDGFGEVEIHLHHDNDTSENLRRDLYRFKTLLHERHGLLTKDAAGQIRYGFIHGNWALDNSLPDGRWCGVNDEVQALIDTGCYADLTMPAAPSPAQTRTVNRIYYAVDDPNAPRSHDFGTRAGVYREAPPNSLLVVQGPLKPSFRRRKGFVPRLENAALHGNQPPTSLRWQDWLDCRVCVEGRPDWVFIKVHTHGAPEKNAETLLGEPTAAFHRYLASEVKDRRHRLHYVTARELVNIVHAAEAGKSGDAGQFRDYRYPPPPGRR